MLSPLCSLWPLLAALLFGWLLCGWFARQFLRSPDRFGTSSSVSPAWASFQRVYWTIAATLAFLLLASWVAGVGPGGRACRMAGVTASGPSAPRAAAAPVAKPAAPVEAPKAVASAVAVAPSAAPASAPAPASAAPPAAAKLYFPLDKITLPQNTVVALLPLVNYQGQ